MIQKLTDAVFRIIERDAPRLLRARPDFHIALNLSAEEICRPDIVDRLRALVQRMGIEARNLQVEATERVFMNVETSRRNIRLLRESGIKVAIDDFGTGYSSLSYLARLPIQAVKIDQRFVHGLEHNRNDESITQAIIALSHSLGLRVIAEGVETATQFGFLKDHGCDEAQGFLISKPLEANDLFKWWRMQEEENRIIGRQAEMWAHQRTA